MPVEPRRVQRRGRLVCQDAEQAQVILVEGVRRGALDGEGADDRRADDQGQKHRGARGVLADVRRPGRQAVHLREEVIDEQRLARRGQPTDDALADRQRKICGGLALAIADPHLDDVALPLEQAQLEVIDGDDPPGMLIDELAERIFVQLRLDDGAADLGQRGELGVMARQPAAARPS